MGVMRRSAAAEAARRWDLDEVGRRVQLYGVMPAWIGAGLADWWHHRRTRIERNAGVGESAIHAMMMAETSVPTMLALFCEVDAGVLAVAAGSLGAHQATAYADVAYAQSRRYVSPGEQQVHSLLEVVPMVATVLLTALHWDQALSLVRRGGRAPDFRLRPKERPLSPGARAAVLAGITLFGAIPYAEEMLRCLRAKEPSTAR